MSKFSYKLRGHNVYFQCAICQKWFDGTKEDVYGITQIVGFQPNQQGQFGPAQALVPVDEKCFKVHKMQDKDPSLADGKLVDKSKLGIGVN